MKKVLKVSTALLLSLATVLSLSVIAFASSVTGVVEVTGAVDSTGAEVKVTQDSISSELLTAATAAKEISGAAESETTVLWQMDLSAPSTPVTITFSLNGVGGKVYVFHFTGGQWKNEGELKIDGNKGTHTFNDLSPVALVRVAPSQGTTGGNSTGVKTGDTNNVAFWGSLMIIAAAGAVGTILYSKKRKTN